MNECYANEQEQKLAEKIRRQYGNREEDKMEQLRKLDGKVKSPGIIAGCVLGVLGALVMGSGMSLVMVWENMQMGLLLGIPGLIALVLVYPVYLLVTGSRKKKYAGEIMRLSEEVLRRREAV